MLRINFIVGALVAFLFLGLAGVAVAGEGNSRDILGTDEYRNSVPETNADWAARDYVYDQEALARVGTEGGNLDFIFDAPESKADIAARDHVYDQDSLARVGTEGGSLEFNFSQQSDADVAGKGDSMNTKCSNC